MVSKRISAWITRRFPSLGPPRPRCPSIVRMLTIRGGVTSACSVHLNRWFGDVLDLSKPCRWLVYGFVVSFLIVLTSPLEGDGVRRQIRVSEIGTRQYRSHSASARHTWRYVVNAIRRRGATQAVALVEFTVNIPR